jgi:hypothetical protein
LSGERLSNSKIQSLRGAMPLREKIDLIQSDMEISYFADRPIPCCMPFDGGAVDTPRPWKLADFSGQSTPRFRANKPGRPVQVTAADWLNNENSSSLTGEYLLSQALRYECTKEEAALEQCHKAINALQTIAQLPGPDRFGWVCKPFGARARIKPGSEYLRAGRVAGVSSPCGCEAVKVDRRAGAGDSTILGQNSIPH